MKKASEMFTTGEMGNHALNFMQALREAHSVAESVEIVRFHHDSLKTVMLVKFYIKKSTMWNDIKMELRQHVNYYPVPISDQKIRSALIDDGFVLVEIVLNYQ